MSVRALMLFQEKFGVRASDIVGVNFGGVSRKSGTETVMSDGADGGGESARRGCNPGLFETRACERRLERGEIRRNELDVAFRQCGEPRRKLRDYGLAQRVASGVVYRAVNLTAACV